MSQCRRDEDWQGSLAWGLGLVAVGTIILLQYFDVVPFRMWRDWWPFIIIAIGLTQLLLARGPQNIGGGLSLALLGVWFLMAANRMYGLTWANSWPLALVASGAGMVARSVAAGFFPKPDRHPAGCRCEKCSGG